jgi:hypothetical protein
MLLLAPVVPTSGLMLAVLVVAVGTILLLRIPVEIPLDRELKGRLLTLTPPPTTRLPTVTPVTPVLITLDRLSGLMLLLLLEDSGRMPATLVTPLVITLEAWPFTLPSMTTLSPWTSTIEDL